MRIDTYELEHGPKKGYAPPARAGRVAAEATYGGAVVQSSAGHLSDAVHTISFDGVESLAAKTKVREVPGIDNPAAQMTAPGHALACRIDVAAGQFAAISAVLLRLGQWGGAGMLSVEVWDTAGAGPQTKVGLLGVIDVEDIAAASWGDIELWSDVAWPLLAPGGYLVLNGAGLTAGTVAWAGEVLVDTYYKYTPAGGWVQQIGQPCGTFWQGSQYPILRGMAGAYCYPGGAGPADRTLEMDDGHRYTVKIMAARGQYALSPISRTSRGRAKIVDLDVMFVAEIGEQVLTPAP